MSKQNTELAKKIIAQLGEATKHGFGDSWIITVPALGFRQTVVKTKTEKVHDTTTDGEKVKGGEVTEHEVAVKTTKAEAYDIATGVLADELDSGSIILSDTWAEDNLEG